MTKNSIYKWIQTGTVAIAFIAPIYNLSSSDLMISHSSLISDKSKQNTFNFIFSELSQNLPAAYKYKALDITNIIFEESEKYNFDPLFIFSIIREESRFNPLAIGSVGEIGLMQIRPQTATWLNSKFKISQSLDLKNPMTNIRIGAFYLNYLKNKLDPKTNHFISAYNMGLNKVKKNLKSNIEPKIYKNKVLKHYITFQRKLDQKVLLADTLKMEVYKFAPIAAQNGF